MPNWNEVMQLLQRPVCDVIMIGGISHTVRHHDNRQACCPVHDTTQIILFLLFLRLGYKPANDTTIASHRVKSGLTNSQYMQFKYQSAHLGLTHLK